MFKKLRNYDCFWTCFKILQITFVMVSLLLFMTGMSFASNQPILWDYLAQQQCINKTDVFSQVGDQWRYSSGGGGNWQNLATSDVSLADLRFGDFDGDGKTDVFSQVGDQWRYSSGGGGNWQNLATSDVSLADLRFGDFDGPSCAVYLPIVVR